MRVLIDTNVFISYLLNPQSAGVIPEIFTAMSQEAFTLLLPEALLEEIVVTVSNKPKLAERIPRQELQAFVTALHELGEIIPRIKDPIPAATRDPKDDFLLAYALVGAADCLVTGDKDLLVLEIQGLEILAPRQFRELLAA